VPAVTDARWVGGVRPVGTRPPIAPRERRFAVSLPMRRRDHVVAPRIQNFLTGRTATAAGQPTLRRERRQDHFLAAA